MGASTSTPATPPECCPPDHVPPRNAADAGATAAPTGRMVSAPTADGSRVCVYVAGGGGDAPLRGAVVLVHDAFGLTSGRTMQYADELRALLGDSVAVVAPDLFGAVGAAMGDNDRDLAWRACCGGLFGGIYERIRYPWDAVEAKLNDVIALLRRDAAEGGLGVPSTAPLAGVGFCWGGWACFRAAKAPSPFVCATSAHPSAQVQWLQRSGPTLKEVVDAVSIPLLLCPTKSEPAMLQPDGWIAQSLPAGSAVVPYPRETHGFANRGDVRVPVIREDVLDVQRRMADFIRDNFAKAGVA